MIIFRDLRRELTRGKTKNIFKETVDHRRACLLYALIATDITAPIYRLDDDYATVRDRKSKELWLLKYDDGGINDTRIKGKVRGDSGWPSLSIFISTFFHTATEDLRG